MEPGSEGENYPESLGNTFAVATMAGKDEASKQKSAVGHSLFYSWDHPAAPSNTKIHGQISSY